MRTRSDEPSGGTLRDPTRGSARSLIAIGSLLALVALALSPVARAQNSHEIVYPLAGAGVESVGTEKPDGSGQGPKGNSGRHSGHTNPGPTAPTTGEERAEPEPESEREPEAEERDESRAAAPSKRSSHPPGGHGHASERTSSNTPDTSGRRPVRNLSPGPAGSATGIATSGSAGGGSSPVVPILIAVVVLAALSIGVVLYRERRQGGGSARGAP